MGETFHPHDLALDHVLRRRPRAGAGRWVARTVRIGDVDPYVEPLLGMDRFRQPREFFLRNLDDEVPFLVGSPRLLMDDVAAVGRRVCPDHHHALIAGHAKAAHDEAARKVGDVALERLNVEVRLRVLGPAVVSRRAGLRLVHLWGLRRLGGRLERGARVDARRTVERGKRWRSTLQEQEER